MRELLDLQIIGGVVPWVLTLISAALLIALLVRRPTKGWVIGSAIAIVVGVAVAVGVFTWANVTGYFEIQLPDAVLGWTAAAFAGIGLALVCIWRGRWWQRTIAVGAVVAFALTGTVQVNAAFGIDPTVADMLGITVSNPIALPSGQHVRPANAGDALYLRWHQSASTPAQGQTGTVSIPGVKSHFHARLAGLYLPPAALAPNAPALPLMIMMMGFPGVPSIQPTAGIVAQYAAAHHGLAPIVIVADQVGTGGDPGCVNGARGNAEQYITTDVLDWARTHLNVIQNPRYWTIAGYSNGATCAVKIAAQYPKVFRNLLAVSPELYIGTHYSGQMIRKVFRDNRLAWQDAKPGTILQRNAHKHHYYRGVYGVVTTGALDNHYGHQTHLLVRDARKAGMFIDLQVLPGVSHVGANVTDGLTTGIRILGSRLGLAPAL
jgi:pimeloyl-ACP methyl ester carboxylesterase